MTASLSSAGQIGTVTVLVTPSAEQRKPVAQAAKPTRNF